MQHWDFDHFLSVLCCGFHYETYIGISPYRTLAVDWAQCMVVYVMCELIVCENTNVVHFLCDMWKYMFNEQGVCLMAHTLFIERVLYFPVSPWSEHRLHIFQDYPCLRIIKVKVGYYAGQLSLLSCSLAYSFQFADLGVWLTCIFSLYW